MITIIEYSDQKKEEWNRFNVHSKNGMFLFNRNYMDYHKDRFVDSSLMFYENNKLIALLPGNKKDDIFYSHGGLTFGGFISDNSMTVTQMISLFQITLDYLKNHKFCTLVYKCIPSTYHLIPSEEDRYVLHQMGSQLKRRDVTSTINLKYAIGYQKARTRCVSKAKNNGLVVTETNDFDSYWIILEDNLARQHSVKPVHTVEEMKLLKLQFPKNIHLFGSFQGEEMSAGVVVYESPQVAHAQYIACNETGRNIGALDLVFDMLIDFYRESKIYFDFGISTENEGKYLNEGLIFYKEGFGARAIVHDFYEVNLIDS